VSVGSTETIYEKISRLLNWLRRNYPESGAPEKTVTRRGRRGPEPGTTDRFGDADRALFPAITRLMKRKNISPGEAARLLIDKIDGRGSESSRARRLAGRYQREAKN
jgi:hypothetical protein